MRIMRVACAFLIVASVGAEALPAKAYVGLFADEAHSTMSVDYTGTSTQFELWLWWLPSERGLMAVEFGMTYPSNVVQSTVTYNSLGCMTIGCCGWWLGDRCMAFGDCQTDWVWTHHQTCFLTDALPSVIEIGPPSYATVMQVANCEPGYPMELATILNKFALNKGEVISVEPQSWGAIKSLFE